MKKLLLTAAALPVLSIAALTPSSAQIAKQQVERLRDAALKDDLAWDITEGLTTEVGPRMPGTEAEARGRTWAVARLKALGFQNVRVEPFDMPVWVRGAEKAEILSPFPQPLVITALGNSAATPANGITAEVIGFESVAELEAAPDADVRGKIVFVTHRMMPTTTGVGYGQFGAPRRQGPTIASRKGAVGIVVRSIGTDYHRNPHTGAQDFAPGVTPIPAGALTVPDSEQLERILKRGRPVTMRLTLTPRNTGVHQSGNVIAEIPGRDPSLGVVVAACHLDSWDLGTGAIDDASGCGITAAAAKRVGDAGKPLRTIRLVWFGAEEVGLVGAQAYRAKHRDEKHAVIAESDLGADRVWRFQSRVSPAAQPAVDRIAAALAPLGIVKGSNREASGSDISVLTAIGFPTFELTQDATRYFDYHHTPDDTLDKVDLDQLRQNVAAWTTMLAIAANEPVEFGPVPTAGTQ